MSFLTNLVLFSPLLLIALVVLVVLDKADSLRRGAGLGKPEAEAEAETERLVPTAEDTPEDGGGDGLVESGGSGGGGGGEGREGATSPTSGDEGFQFIGPERSEDEIGVVYDDNEEDDRGEEDDFEIVEHTAGGGPDGNDYDPGAAGPSNPSGQQQLQQQNLPRPIPRTKIVGAKKAASLARRDQRRAYNEFLRSRALAAAEEARLEEEARAEAVFAERQRRALAEEEIVARREKERLARLEREREVERGVKVDLGRLRGLVSGDGKGEARKVWKVDDLAGEVGRSGKWIIEGLEREGLLGVREWEGGREGVGEKEWEMRMLTGKGYYVVVRGAEVRGLFERLEESREKGVGWSEMGRMLEEVLTLG